MSEPIPALSADGVARFRPFDVQRNPGKPALVACAEARAVVEASETSLFALLELARGSSPNMIAQKFSGTIQVSDVQDLAANLAARGFIAKIDGVEVPGPTNGPIA